MIHSDADLLVAAYQRGHFWNPANPNGLNVDLGSLPKLTLADTVAREAIASMQLADANMNLLVEAFHKRPLQPDGSVGPATMALANLPRCAMPDHAPPAGASFHYDNPELNAAVESYQEFKVAAATGSGSWPVGCDPNRKDVHSVVVGIDTSNASSGQKAMMDEVLKMVEETEAEIGQAVRHVRDGSFSRPQHDVKFQLISGGVIGFAYFPTPNTCNQVVTARIDNSFNPRATVLAELLTHEYKGHSDGLEHTNGGIMNPSIGSPTSRASWIGDKHEGTKKRFFGGVAIPGPTPPPPPGPSPTDPTRPVFDPITVRVGGKPFKFLMIPYPEV